MAWYLNKYECTKCGIPWEDEWSCGCDDECPNCGAADHSPFETEDLSVIVERDEDGEYSIYYSPPEAGHHPDYVLLATTKMKNLAKLLKAVAFDLSQPA